MAFLRHKFPERVGMGEFFNKMLLLQCQQGLILALLEHGEGVVMYAVKRCPCCVGKWQSDW
jgi:hypothetical protein